MIYGLVISLAVFLLAIAEFARTLWNGDDVTRLVMAVVVMMLFALIVGFQVDEILP